MGNFMETWNWNSLSLICPTFLVIPAMKCHSETCHAHLKGKFTGFLLFFLPNTLILLKKVFLNISPIMTEISAFLVWIIYHDWFIFMPASSLIISRSSPSQVFPLWEHCSHTATVGTLLISSFILHFIRLIVPFKQTRAHTHTQTKTDSPFNVISDWNSEFLSFQCHFWSKFITSTQMTRTAFPQHLAQWDYFPEYSDVSLHHDLITVVVQDNLTVS